jgi:hypothetical protein
MDPNEPDSSKPTTDQDSSMFAAQPIWERNQKKKGFGRRRSASAAATAPVAPEPRTFAAERDYDEPLALDTPVDSPLDRPLASTPVESELARTEYAAMNPSAATTTNSTLAAETAADAGLVAPIGTDRSARSTAAPKSRGIAPAAIAAGVVALGALGATGWYMSRDREGVPELTPGSTTASEVAAAPLTPTNPPAQVAVNEASPPPAAATPPAAEPPRTTVQARNTARTTARARPAASAPSAASSGANASTSAVLPDGPQPYSSVNPGTTAPTQVNPPMVTLPPTTTEAPAQVPSTPPTLTQEPAPTTEAPKPETTVTPPPQ